MLASETHQQTLHKNYLALTSRIREWLSSEQIVYLIGEITGRLGIKGEKLTIIPDLTFRLVVQDIDPLDFINELSHELEVSFQTAKAIAEDIEHKVLKPIESDLRRDVGVDVKLIYFGKPSAQRAEPKLQGAAVPEPAPIPTTSFPGGPTPAKIEVEKPVENIRRSDLQPEIGSPKVEAPPKPLAGGPTEWEKLRRETKPAAPPTPEPTRKIEEKPVETATPFMLHQEGITYQPSPAKIEKPEPMLNIKVQNYYAESPKKIPPKPVAVVLETPSINNEQKTRVVHYNEMRTPLNNLGVPKTSPPENRVDLRKFTKPDGNTVDLRQNKK